MSNVIVWKRIEGRPVCTLAVKGRIPQRLFTLYSIIKALPRLIYAAMGTSLYESAFAQIASYCTTTGRDTLLPSLSVMRAM